MPKTQTIEGPPLYRLLKSIQPPEIKNEAEWTRAAGVSTSFFQDVKKGRRPRVDNLEKVVEAAGLSPAKFYALEAGGSETAPDGQATVRSPRLPFRTQGEQRDVPLLGTAQGADLEVTEDGRIDVVELIDLDLDDVVDTVRRPSTLAGRDDVYALTTIGDSMAPAYEDGDPTYVDPKQQPKIGDYVIVQLMKRDGEGEGRVVSVLIKRLVRRTSNYVELEQFNPPLTFRIPASQIARIHRVIRWREIVYF